MEKTTLVIGHRNPDTDSVCSAIAYAYLKQQQGIDATPARAGKLNPETEFVLNYFSVPIPKLVNDLYPRLGDIKLKKPPTAFPEATLRDVAGLFVEYNGLKSVPVLNANSEVVGIITVGDLAKRYYNELAIHDIENGAVSYANILKTLEGNCLTGDLSTKFNGKIKIAASKESTIDATIETDDIIIVGDRNDVQISALNKGAHLIITRDIELSEEVIAIAKKRQAIIISTPYDTYTTTRLINQSITIEHLMTKNVICFKHSDLLSEVKKQMVAANFVSYPVLEGGKYIGLIDRATMLIPERQKVILVDHNERSQAVEGIESAELLEIIDHHRLGGLTTGAPIFIRQEPVGSTATIVARLMWQNSIIIPQKIAGILLAAIISDTLYFRSPTGTYIDEDTAKQLAKTAEINNLDEFALDVLRHGSSINTTKAQDIVRNDIKEFYLNDQHISVSQINIMDRKQALKRLPELLQALEELQKEENTAASLLMLTDVLQGATDLLISTHDEELLYQAFGSEETPKHYYLPGVMSRKKQIIPVISEWLQKTVQR